MPEKNILLSICIPTYNRAELLKISVSSVCEQITKEKVSNIELVVVDNASSDLTKQIVDHLILIYPNVNFKYILRPENIGSDNVILCTEYAVGEFIFILSDDDYLFNNTINLIIETIKNTKDLKAITINCCEMLRNGKPNISKSKFSKARSFSDLNDSLIFLSTYISFLSSVIFRRDSINLDKIREHSGSQVIQCFAFMYGLSRTGLHVVLPKAIVVYRSANTSYKWFNVFTEQFLYFLNWTSFFLITAKTIKKVKDQHFFNSIVPHILLCRTNPEMRGKFFFDEELVNLQIYKFYPEKHYITAILMNLPVDFLGKIYPLLRKIKNIMQKTTL